MHFVHITDIVTGVRSSACIFSRLVYMYVYDDRLLLLSCWFGFVVTKDRCWLAFAITTCRIALYVFWTNSICMSKVPYPAYGSLQLVLPPKPTFKHLIAEISYLWTIRLVIRADRMVFLIARICCRIYIVRIRVINKWTWSVFSFLIHIPVRRFHLINA